MKRSWFHRSVTCRNLPIIDDSMVSALCLAAKSGADVRIITPHIYDKALVHMTTRSYYRELIHGGVKIYEYSKGFIHSKTFVSDDHIATVGTVNMDFRSLYLHFECGVWIYSDSNIRKKTLLDALRSPMLMAYHDRQPFDENMLRPCPMLENPEELYAMVNVCRAHSTDSQSPEKVADLYAKCESYSREWAPVAEKIWTASLQNSPK